MHPRVSMAVARMLLSITGSFLGPIMRYTDVLLHFSMIITIFHAEHLLLEFISIIYLLDIFKTAIISFWNSLFLNIVQE